MSSFFKKYLKYFIGLFLFLLLFYIVLNSIISQENLDFYRVKLPNNLRESEYFKIRKSRGRINYRFRDKSVLLKEVHSTDGYFFKLEGTKRIKIKPKITGKVGFFLSLYIESMNQKEVEFSLYVKRKDQFIQVEKIGKSKYFSDLIKIIDLEDNDRLILIFKGNGIVHFSKPIIYKIIDRSDRKYVFLIGVDTFRGDQIGKKVNGIPLTPNLEAFKKDAVDFSNCYAQGAWTLPSFMSLFTALYEYNHQVSHNTSLDLEKPFLVKEISKKFITVNLNSGIYVAKRFGFSRGFDFFKSKSAYFSSEGGKLLFKDAINLVKKTQFPRSFIFLHTYQTHNPYSPPEEFLYKLNKTPLNKELKSVPTSGFPKRRFLELSDDLRESYIELYQAEILAFDSFFGDFIGELKKNKIYDQSMIIFMSDHGEEFFEHKGWDHAHTLYNELIKVPLLVKFPKNRFKNTVIKENVGVIDILPTVLTHFNIKYKKSKIDGKSLIPVINGNKIRKYLYSSLTISRTKHLRRIHSKFAIFFNKYKLIYNYKYSEKSKNYFREYSLPPETDQFEIFDLENDKEEMFNIASDRDDIIEKLASMINRIKIIMDNNILEVKKKSNIKVEKVSKEKLKNLGYF